MNGSFLGGSPLLLGFEGKPRGKPLFGGSNHIEKQVKPKYPSFNNYGAAQGWFLATIVGGCSQAFFHS